VNFKDWKNDLPAIFELLRDLRFLITYHFLNLFLFLFLGECQTPDSKNGSCIPILQCAAIYDMVERSQQLSMDEKLFVRSSQCDFKDRMPYVCCPLLPDFKSCGISSLGDRIPGGERIKNYGFPWLALIQYQNGE
jgi:Regulatory CLIP domain of proteinases